MTGTRDGAGGKTAHQLPTVEFAQRTDAGRDPQKQVNEDTCRYGETRLGHLAVTCDGMGGHEGGREASRIAVESVFEVVEAASSDARPADVLREGIVLANTRVRGLAEVGHEASRPGSTIVAVLLHARGAEIAHVGDSRIYMTHGADVVQLTKDHSMVQQMVDAGLIAQEEAATHPNANQISRALGMKADVDVEVRKTPVAFVAGDAFVLCSDGLSDLVPAREILSIVGSGPAAQAVGQLVDLANARGGHDNITVQILRARESAVATSEGSSGVAPTIADTVGKTLPDAGLAPSDAARSTHVPPHPNRARRELATTSNDEGDGSRRRSPWVILGVVLGIAGLGVAGGLVWFMSHQPTKKVPVFVVDAPDAAATLATPTTSVEDHVLRPDPAEAPTLAPLVAPDAGRRRHHPSEDPTTAPTPTPVPPPPPPPASTEQKIEW